MMPAATSIAMSLTGTPPIRIVAIIIVPMNIALENPPSIMHRVTNMMGM